MTHSVTYLTRLLILSGLLASCGGSREQNAQVTVSLNPGDSEISLTDVMDITGWIEIKADSSKYIGEASKIETFNSEYYIMDPVTQKCVLRYGADGSLLNTIGQQGEGPGEYPQLTDFTIDRKNGQVLILSYGSNVYIYTLDGTFYRKVQLTEGFISNISCNSKGLMATSGYSATVTNGKNYLLYQFDNDFKLESEWFPYTTPLRSTYPIVGANCLMTNGNQSYYLDNINRHILAYDCNTNNVDTLMSFDLKNSMPVEVFKDNMRFITEQLNYNWIKDFVLTDSSIIVGYVYDKNYSISIFDFAGEVIKSGELLGPFPQCFPDNSGTIVSPIPVDLYLGFWEKQNLPIKPSFDVNEDTNLVLMKWKCRS